MFKNSPFLLLLLFFCGCRLTTPYEPPALLAPSEWKTPQQEPSCQAPVENWWEVFGDERLNELEELALLQNPNLYVALQRIVEARGTAGISRANLYPQANLAPTYDRAGAHIHFRRNPFSTIPNSPFKPTMNPQIREYTVPVDMSYQIDLWGQYREQYASDLAQLDAQKEAYRASMLSLTSDLASYYFNLKTADAQIDLLKQTIELRKITLALSRSRNRSGLTNSIDELNSELLLSNAEADYEDNLRQRTLFENAIAALVGIPASDLHLDFRPLSSEPPVIPAGLPSTILLQRPDIGEAERKIASQYAEIGVAYSSFFPSLQLTGALEYAALDVGRFLDFTVRFWELGVNAAQFLFDAGQRSSNLEATWARFREAEGSYQQTVITAFREVEDALNNLEHQDKQYDLLQESVNFAVKTEKLSIKRYRNGLTGQLDMIDSERSALEAQINAINILGQRFQSTVQLIKALGGSWGSTSCDLCHGS